ncbi:hypothetical protein ACEPAF_6156 [Sanghuangporus sanghuang]
MLFTRIIPFFAMSLTFGSLALSGPAAAGTELTKRDNADIEQVFTTLKTSTDSILPQIQSAAASGNATDDNVTPLITQLVSALNSASSSLSGLSSSSRTLNKRQSDSDIATLVAGIIEDISGALEDLVGDAASIPDLGVLFSGIDAALAEVLTGLEILLSGVLQLVADLLTDVAGLLNQLAFGLTLGALGL